MMQKPIVRSGFQADRLNVPIASKPIIDIILAARESPFEDFLAKLNKGKFRSAGEHTTLHSMHLSELGGILHVLEHDLSETTMQYIYARDTGQQVTNEERQADNSGRLLANMIYRTCESEKIGRNLPSMRIAAGLHAVLRWNKEQKIQGHGSVGFSTC